MRQEHLVFDVNAHGAYLATRAKARDVRGDAADYVRALAPHGHMVLDFTGVEAMTIGFADEFLTGVLRDFAGDDGPPRTIVLYGLNEETRETSSVCLERRDQIAAEMVDRKPRLLGAPPFLVETYGHAVRLGSFHTADLSKAEEVRETAVHNRLTWLLSCGAVSRERVVREHQGGRKYVYHVPPSWPGRD